MRREAELDGEALTDYAGVACKEPRPAERDVHESHADGVREGLATRCRRSASSRTVRGMVLLSCTSICRSVRLTVHAES